MSAVAVPTAAADAPRPAPVETFRNEQGRIHDGWKTTFASTIGMMFGPSSVIIFCFGVFVPQLERAFGWGIGAISFGATLASLSIIAASLLSGYLVDRFSVRTLALVSMPLFGATVAAGSLMNDNIYWFYFGIVFATLIGVGVGPIIYNKATAVWFDRRLGFSLGLTNMGIGLGAAFLPALVGYVVANYGWRNAYVAVGVLAVIIPWPIVFAFLKHRAVPVVAGASKNTAAASPNLGLTFAETRRTREFWLTAGAFAILGIASSGAFVIHMVRILVDTGMAPASAAGLMSVLGIALIVGRVGTGWLLDRISLQTIMIVLCVIAAGAVALLAAGAPFGTAALCAAVGGLLMGAEFDVLGFLIARYFGKLSFGSIYGAIFAIFQLASAIGVGVLGWWRSTQGSYSAGLYVIAALLLVSAVLFAMLGQYRFAAAGTAAK